MPVNNDPVNNDPGNGDGDNTSAVPIRAIVVLAAAVVAAWIAAGSTGLLAHPLRHALTVAALGVAVVAGWPRRDAPLGAWLTLAAAVVLGLILTAAAVPAVNVLAVTLVTAALARPQEPSAGRVILIASLATAVLGIFCLACSSIPTVWLAADTLGRWLGSLAGTVTGEPLWLGAGFGGVDFLVLMAALYAGWLVATAPPRLPRAICGAVAILAGHLLYLAVLSFSNRILAALPEVVLPPELENSHMGVWAWGNAVRTLLPWNLPMLAVAIHATIAAVMFRWATWLPVAEPEVNRDVRPQKQTKPFRRIDTLLYCAPAILAAAIPVSGVLSLGRSNLDGKTIMAGQQGFLDWDKPEYGASAGGTYGMLPLFVESLGGKFVKSADLSQEDLDEADVLLLLHPNQDWSKRPEVLDRVWKFVRRGGALLLVADPEMVDGEFRSTFDDVLRPTAMRVRRDTAMAQTAGWEDTCTALAHPATIGIGDGRNRFGLMMGSSIEVGWPARPMLIGRWAFANPGSDATRTGATQYDAGEKLGDLVLAAEQPLGKGTVVVLADTSSLHNDMIANSYTFVGRLLGYLAGRGVSTQTWWRQLFGLAAMMVLVGLLAWRADPLRIGAAAVILAACLITSTAISHHTARVLPGNHGDGPELACIDASHLEAYSTDTWGDFGIAGLSRVLMRTGYLPLMLPELTGERLKHAELLISIAPARPFSATERETVEDFVTSGGTFICMAGAEEVSANHELLEGFGFQMQPSPVSPARDIREPEPLGNFRTFYLNTDQVKAAMQSYAGWEVKCERPDAWRMALWSDGITDRPFVVSRAVGGGQVVVIGDTYLAVNQNLESAVNIMPDNVVFWRWLLTHVTDREDWVPSAEQESQDALPAELPAEEPAGEDPAGDEVAP